MSAETERSPVPPLVVSDDELVRAGAVKGPYQLDLNGSVTVPYDFPLSDPWDLPSRLFRFPVEAPPMPGGNRALGLMHPALADHPFVAELQQKLGAAIPPDGAPNEFGYSHAGLGLWWHAVDLMTADRAEDLFRTRRFTTDDDITRAIGFRLGTSGPRALTPARARKMLERLGVAEPTDEAELLDCFSDPSPVQSEGPVRWPVNSKCHRVNADLAWGMVLGLERGWFAYAGGHAGWTALGRQRHEARGSATYVDHKTGQGAFAF